MRTLTIENIDEETLSRLESRAELHKRTLSDEVSEIVRAAVRVPSRRAALVERANRIAAMTPKGIVQIDSVELLREDRDR